MRRTTRQAAPRVAIVALALLAAAAAAAADAAAQGQVEVGFDGGARFDGEDWDSQRFTLALPFASVRTGLHFERRFSLETSFAWSRVEDLDTDDALSQLDLALYGLFHLGDDIRRTRFHLLLGVPFRYAERSGQDAFSTVGVMGGLGVTLPLARVWAMRLQGQGAWFESDDTRLLFLLGFSAIVD
ncbi:MAG TPA: outer membrane beta-barrel protein [Longimicrobiales bacterium]|nr:outer membrane beta-barrel protein [Longimicrobiales bacterium]